VLESANTTVFKDINLHLADVERTNFVLYPNPANDVVTLRLSQPTTINQTVVVYDMQGKIHLQQQLEAGTGAFSIETHTLPAGIYLLRCGNGMQRLVIQR